MIYLASPYSHPNPAVREARYETACRATANLLRTGLPIFSPIVHGHPLVRFNLPGDWSFWEPLARWYIERCDEVVVLTLDGWRESEGVRAEVAIAREAGTPVWMLEPADIIGASAPAAALGDATNG